MRLLTFSSLYPNTASPGNGIFIEHRVRHQHAERRLDTRVVAPVPWFPFKHKMFGRYRDFSTAPHSAHRHGLDIVYPRFPVVPKLGMSISPFLLAASMVKPLKRLIRSGYDFDVIDAYYFYPDGVAAAWLGRYFGKPVVINALGSDINCIAHYRLAGRMIRWASRNAAGITTVSRALRDELKTLGAPGSSVHVIYHGVDHQLFRPPDDRPALRAELGFEHPTCLAVGHLVELKGHSLAIHALKALSDARLVIAGNGVEREALVQLACELGVRDRVQFLGEVSQETLVRYYGAADVLLQPSSHEGVPNVLIEAMACGTPVVATRVGGMPEIVSSPAAGRLMRERSVEALVEAIRDLWADPPDRSAVAHCTDSFSWQRTTDEHIALVRQILRDEPPVRDQSDA